VAAAAQSPRLTHQELALQGERGGLLWLPVVHQPCTGRAYEVHRTITDAIEDGDGERARELTEQHIMAAVERLVELHLELTGP
jgi:GntR family transcriptional repressor for pyruvate dehydrogenase complex